MANCLGITTSVFIMWRLPSIEDAKVGNKQKLDHLFDFGIHICKIFQKPFGIFGTYVAAPPPRIFASRIGIRQASHDTKSRTPPQTIQTLENP